MKWKARRERRHRKRLLEKCQPEKIISSLEKKVQREKPKNIFEWFRQLFFVSQTQRTLQYAKQVLPSNAKAKDGMKKPGST